MTPARLGALVALATLVLDQATKLGLFYGADLPLAQPIVLGPYAEFVLRWNRGISYGLLQQHTEWGRWGLVAVSLAASLGLSAWLARAGNRLLALALGLVVGGALGNAVDRIAFGAVLDFVHLHVGDWSWYVFNVADVAICAGVAGLLIDGLAPARPGEAAGGADSSPAP